MRNILTGSLLCVGLLGFAVEPVFTQGWFNKQAAEGYDVVAYFAESKAVPGNEKYTHRYKDTDWLFASQDNLDKFKADPERYAPQYGGHCAYGVSRGYGVRGDPKYWAIVDDKLYLNYNAEVQQTWKGDTYGFIATANNEWSEICTDKECS